MIDTHKNIPLLNPRGLVLQAMVAVNTLKD